VQDDVIMPVRGEGLVDEDDEQEERNAQKVGYVLHPNCGIFDDE
jgi:DNA replication licensing factor MCM6